QTLLTLPVDGIDGGKLAAFKKLCAPNRVELILATRRARALGIETNAPIALALDERTSAERLLELVADRDAKHSLQSKPASVAAVAAIQLAKLAQGLPAVLAAEVNHSSTTRFDPPLVTVDAAAVAHYRNHAIRSLKKTGETRIPLNAGIKTRFVSFTDAFG